MVKKSYSVCKVANQAPSTLIVLSHRSVFAIFCCGHLLLCKIGVGGWVGTISQNPPRPEKVITLVFTIT